MVSIEDVQVSDEENEDEAGQNGSFSFTNVREILDSHDNPECFQLPPHFRCVRNTLNLLASTDADKALCDIAYKRQYHAAFPKCIALWEAVNKSSKAAYAVKEVYDKQLIRPVVTRRNSKYDIAKRLMDCQKI